MSRERADFSRIDWSRDGLRLTTRTDATTRDAWRRYRDLCTTLWNEGQVDVLHAVKAGDLSLRDVLDEVQRTGDFGVKGLLARLTMRRELHPILLDATTRLGRSTKTRGRHVTTLNKLVRAGVVTPGKTMVRDLLTVDWHVVRTRWMGRRGKGLSSSSDWNHARRFLSAALTQLFGGSRTGQSHPFRKQVLDRFPSEVQYEREVTLTLEEFRALVAALPERYRAAIITLAITGIRLGEYLTMTRDALEPNVPAIRVSGKTGPRPVKIDPSLWPWVDAAVPSPVKASNALRRPFREAARAIGHPGLRLHDLRHLNATAAMAAGAAIDAVRDHLGHADAKTTMGYLKGARRDVASKALAQAFAPVLRGHGVDRTTSHRKEA